MLNMIYLYDDIFKGEEEIQEFLIGMSLFKMALNVDLEVKLSIEESDIIEALKKITALTKVNSSSKKENISLLYELVEKKDVLEDSLSPQLKELVNKSPFTYFDFLKKHLDEDFYSDHLNSILNYPFKKGFNNSLINEILKSCFLTKAPLVKKVKSMREISLLNFDYEPGRLMRMDLFMVLDNSNIVIIENKTKTLEHSSQTQHYYDACLLKHDEKNIYPIMLSPNSQKAECEKYKSLNYIELFHIMTKCLKETPPDMEELKYIEDFYLELKKQFYDPYNNAFKRAQEFRRKCG